MSRTLEFGTLTVQDAFDVAILIEHAAEERYQEFAGLVGGRDAADVFLRMALQESRHASKLRDRRVSLFADAPVRLDRSMAWEVEAPEYAKSRALTSAREATEAALESEKRMCEFFDAALPLIQNQDVKDLFTELRDEERDHKEALVERMMGMPEPPQGDEPPAR